MLDVRFVGFFLLLIFFLSFFFKFFIVIIIFSTLFGCKEYVVFIWSNVPFGNVLI